MTRKETPEWLAELRDPIWGDLRLGEIIAPKHVPAVLKAFGQQHAAARRQIVERLDGMAAMLKYARKHKPPMKFAPADAYLARLENATVNFRSLWAKASPFYRALGSALFITAKREKRLKEPLGEIDPASVLEN